MASIVLTMIRSARALCPALVLLLSTAAGPALAQQLPPPCFHPAAKRPRTPRRRCARHVRRLCCSV